MDAKQQRKMATVNPMSRKGKWTNEEEALTARIIHYFSLGVLQLPEGTTLRAYLAQKLDCDPMRITKKFTGTNCLGKRVYHSCERTTATYEVAKHAVEELAELERRFRARLERNKEKRTGILDIEARLLGSRNAGATPPMDARGMNANASPASSSMHSFAPQPPTGQAAAMAPGAGVAAAAAAAAVAWNPLSQVYSLPPGYPVPPPTQNGVFARPPVPAMPTIHAFGMPHVARSPSSGHPHQLTSAMLHSHQLQQAAAYSKSQQLSPGSLGSPGASAGSGASAKGAGSSSGHGMLSSQSVTDSEKSTGGSKHQQMPPPPPPLPPPQQQQQQGSSAPSSAGIHPQAYLRTASGQMHNPYWPYHPQHVPGDLHSQGAYADFGAGGSAPGATGFAHLGMAYPLQHQQWLHQQQQHAAISGGGGGAIGMSPWQRQHHQVPHPHHPLPSTRGVGGLASSPCPTPSSDTGAGAAAGAVASSLSSHHLPAFSSGNLSSASQTTASCSSTVEGRQCSASPTSSEACGGDAGDPTALPLRARRQLCSEDQGAPPRGASSADAAAVVSAERDTVSSTMASPRELQQMYKPGSSRGNSRRRRPHRGRGGAEDEGSIASSMPRSKATLSNSSQGSTTADNSSSLGSLSGGSSGSGSRTGSGSDEQQSKSDRKGKGGAGGGGSSGSTSGSESGSEETEKQASSETTDDPQTGAPPTSRMDVDGAGGLLMGFIECLTKQHKLDQQQQQQQQQDRHHRLHAPEDKQRAKLSPPLQQKQQQQQRPKPPSPHAFPRVRHKHAARMELEARLASGGAGGGKGGCAGAAGGDGSGNSSPGAKKRRHAIEAYAASSSGRTSGGCGSNSSSGGKGGGGGGVRDAVSPPLRPSQIDSSAAAMRTPRVESRKRPREQQQQGLNGGGLQVPAPARPPTGTDLEEEAGEASSASAGDGSVSSEEGISEEGGYEEDGDVHSWGSSGKETAGSTEDTNEASVSEGDYGAGDERSSSFEERDHTDGFEGGSSGSPPPPDDDDKSVMADRRRSDGGAEAPRCQRTVLAGS